MFLIRYQVDLSNLSQDERKRIYEEIHHAAYMTPSVTPGLGFIEFFLYDNQVLEDWVNIPKSCHIVSFGSSSRSK